MKAEQSNASDYYSIFALFRSNHMYFILNGGNGCIMELDKKFIAQVIQDTRRKAGLKQSELAEKIGISEKHLSKIETGKNYPALDTFLKILDTLDLTLGDFGLQNISDSYPNKVLLQKIINTSSEKQLDACADIITALLKHV